MDKYLTQVLDRAANQDETAVQRKKCLEVLLKNGIKFTFIKNKSAVHVFFKKKLVLKFTTKSLYLSEILQELKVSSGVLENIDFYIL